MAGDTAPKRGERVAKRPLAAGELRLHNWRAATTVQASAKNAPILIAAARGITAACVAAVGSSTIERFVEATVDVSSSKWSRTPDGSFATAAEKSQSIYVKMGHRPCL